MQHHLHPLSTCLQHLQVYAQQLPQRCIHFHQEHIRLVCVAERQQCRNCIGVTCVLCLDNHDLAH